MSSRKRNTDVFDDESDYIDPSEHNKKPRASYESARKTVEGRQNMRRTASGGHFEFDSAITSGKVNQLNSSKQEQIPRAPGKSGDIWQKPALDHIVQYANLNEQYTALVHEHRALEDKGLKRRNSLDLHDAFKAAASDPANLRLVTHQEHTSHGQTLRSGQFPQSEQKRARNLIQTQLDSIPESSKKSLDAFNSGRPKTAVELPKASSGPTSTYSLRKRGNTK